MGQTGVNGSAVHMGVKGDETETVITLFGRHWKQNASFDNVYSCPSPNFRPTGSDVKDLF